MEIDKIILSHIKEYCKMNGIKDVRNFVNKCLLDGFNIMKYGVSPFAQAKPSEVISKPSEGVSTTASTVVSETVEKSQEDKINDVTEVPVKKPRRVRIVKKNSNG